MASIYQFFTPFISASLGFAGSFIIYWIKDRDPSTREFERQTKRLQFWKTFYDLQAVAPIKANVKHEERCKQTMESAAFWVEAIPTKAFRYSKWLSMLAVSLVVSLLYTFLLSPVPIAPPGEEAARVVFELMVFGALIVMMYQIIYEGLRTEITRGLVWLAEHVSMFSFFKEIADT